MDSNAPRADGPPPSFLQLLETHGQLDALFLSHQEALLSLDIDGATALLQEFEKGLRAHIRAEEELLLPVYRRAGPIPGGAPELFTTEHRKMLEYVEGFKETLRQLQNSSPTLKREIIALLDDQAQFKHLVEHHDLREHNILYPALDRVTDEGERRELLDKTEPGSRR
jgi:hemerythrin-like domain-containing protein